MPCIRRKHVCGTKTKGNLCIGTRKLNAQNSEALHPWQQNTTSPLSGTQQGMSVSMVGSILRQWWLKQGNMQRDVSMSPWNEGVDLVMEEAAGSAAWPDWWHELGRLPAKVPKHRWGELSVLWSVTPCMRYVCWDDRSHMASHHAKESSIKHLGRSQPHASWRITRCSSSTDSHCL